MNHSHPPDMNHPPEAPTMFQRVRKNLRSLRNKREGSVFVEYILLITLVGLGVIVGLATVRVALVNELNDLANAINAINC